MNQLSIIVVDDEVHILEALKTHLELKGYYVETSSEPMEALNLMRTRSFDLAMLDINMPRMDGIELLEEAKKIRGEIIPIMITAYTSISKVLMSRIHGAFDYVLKPFRDLDEVDRVLERAIAHLERWNMVLKETSEAKKRKAF